MAGRRLPVPFVVVLERSIAGDGEDGSCDEPVALLTSRCATSSGEGLVARGSTSPMTTGAVRPFCANGAEKDNSTGNAERIGAC